MCKLFISLLLVGLLTSDVFGARLTVQHGNKVKSTNDFPFIVLLAGPKSICTGSLITQSSVLSAGHCACAQNPLTTVYIDTLAIPNLGDSRGISDIVVHPNYMKPCRSLLAGITNVGEVNGQDSAIFKLTSPFYDKTKASLAILDFYSPMPVGSEVMIAGFGKDDFEVSGKNVGVLKYGKMTVATCVRKGIYSTICVKGSSYQNSAPGDSGGPLMRLNKRVVGTVSGMVMYRNGYSEVVYVRVKRHRKFIQSNS